ncbi:MAG: hypothetical protein IPQ06_07405 [Chitinophagaceae bacterium]|nr:hypothetical protein [Chitinophagaceae bacterium]MBL0272890.1 hypothetical protein [Chitinophagaceae bacterium]
MLKKWSIFVAFIMLSVVAFPQSNSVDSVITPVKQFPVTDTSVDLDDLFQDFDAFMDSILSPHSYFLASLSMGKGYYNFESKDGSIIASSKKLTYSPTLGYYHKSGVGMTGTGYLVDDGSHINFYQFALTPSYDYLKNKSFATGISFTKFFTRDSVPFYTTPLQNELLGYFTVRKWWFRPMLSMSYGWGSRTDYLQREDLIQDLRLRRRGFTYINTKESITDLSMTVSVRHDFYWLDAITYKDHFRFTPQLAFTSGTQKFGFNQSSNTYATVIRNNSNVLYSTENIYLDDKLKFQPLSLTMYLRGEYSIGKFFIQPQLTLDYYFPATSKNFNSLFTINVGCMF